LISDVLEGRQQWHIECGDVLDVLRAIPPESVHCVVTSPPYFGLRDYSVAGQIGLEPSIDEYVATMVAVFREVKRVLRRDGSVWCNLGDSYSGAGYSNHANTGGAQRSDGGKQKHILSSTTNLKSKDLCMIPARVALALQADGWYIRSEITWCKRAPMPESVTDRPTSATEKIYLLTKSARYFYDADAVREPHSEAHLGRYALPFNVGTKESNGAGRPNGASDTPGLKVPNPAGRNLWNYWLLSPEPYAAAHFATFPSEIPRRAIAAGTSERGVCAECGAPWRRVVDMVEAKEAFRNGTKYVDHVADGDSNHSERRGQKFRGLIKGETKGWQPTCTHHDAPTLPAVVLDPFSGAGTTVMQALRMGRRGIGIELNPEYVRLSEGRIVGDAPLFNTQEEAAV
jgi:DNA modification methylase